jgi:hypothetical protein
MKTATKAAVIAFGLVSAIILGVSAAYWIYSGAVTTTVNSYALTLNSIPTSVNHYDYLNLNGTLSRNGIGVSGATIDIYLNGTSIATTTTNASGFYSYNYNVTEGESSVLHFTVGYLVP